MTDVRVTVPPLVKVVELHRPAHEAFALFTDRVGDWWPLETFSVGGRDSAGVRFDRGSGGRLVETLRDGTTSTWGTVTRWEPPHVIALTWHPGRSEREATRVEVTFEPTEDGVRVTLVHDGWDRHPDAAGGRARYDTGWDVVLAPFVTASDEE